MAQPHEREGRGLQPGPHCSYSDHCTSRSRLDPPWEAGPILPHSSSSTPSSILLPTPPSLHLLLSYPLLSSPLPLPALPSSKHCPPLLSLFSSCPPPFSLTAFPFLLPFPSFSASNFNEMDQIVLSTVRESQVSPLQRPFPLPEGQRSEYKKEVLISPTGWREGATHAQRTLSVGEAEVF